MPPMPRSSRRTRSSPHRSFSTRELLADPIDMSDDDPSYALFHPPQSHNQSVDDAPPPTSHLPTARIFPLPAIDLNRDTDDEQPASFSPDPDIPPSVLEHFPSKHSSKPRLVKKRPAKTRPFAGVDSLLRTASARQQKPDHSPPKSSPSPRSDSPAPLRPAHRSRASHPRHSQPSDAHEHPHGDHARSSVAPRRATRTLPLHAVDISPIDKPRFDRLLCSESDPREKARFRKLFRSAAGKVTLAQMADVVLGNRHGEALSSEDDIPIPRKSRRLNNRTPASPQISPDILSDDSYDQVGIVEEVDDTGEAVSAIGTKRRRARGKRRGASDDEQASVPLPKSQNTLAHRVKARVANSADLAKDSRALGGKRKAGNNVERKRQRSEGNGKNSEGVRRSKRQAVQRTRKRKEWDSEFEGDDSDLLSEPVEDDEVVGMEDNGGTESGGNANEDEDDEPKILRRRKGKKERKVNRRRKRTRPADAFQSGREELSAREQQERLDFLVKQSADISRDLHRAMAEATSNQPVPAGSKFAERQRLSEKADVLDGGGDNDTAPDAAESRGATQSRREEELVPPTAKNTELQAHQVDGVKWLLTLDAEGLNAILADEMGLGKTIQAITFLASLVLSGSRGPHLVIAPKNVCDHWAKEVRLFYPGKINVVTHLGSFEERLEELEAILDEDNFDIMVTSYEVALRDLFKKQIDGGMRQYRKVLRKFREVEFEYLVVDEAHRLKNDDSKLNVGIRHYGHAQRRLLLTGTPLSNDLKELWSLMNVLNPRIFSSKATFKEWFAAPFDPRQGSRSAKNRLSHAEQSVIVDRLHTVIRPFFRRRVRADVCPSYTSGDEVIVRCPMSQLQRALMLHLRRRAESTQYSLHNIIMAMRMVSSHPFTFSNSVYNVLEKQAHVRLVASCGKFEFLHYSLPRLFAAGHRVLIFSQFRRTLDFLEDLMDLLGVKYGRLDGATASSDRLQAISSFNSPQSQMKVFLLTTRAGGVGINLQSADTVILFDSDWNPSADLQAVSRIQRIGQKKTVHIIRLLTEKSADEHIYDKQRHKLRTQAVAVGAGKFNTSSGAALDQSVRQKDLEKVLQDLDINNYMPAIDQDLKSSAPAEAQSSDDVKAAGDATVRPAVATASGSKEQGPAFRTQGPLSDHAERSNLGGASGKPVPEKAVSGSPDYVVLSQEALDARASRAREWDLKLLRRGEVSLPETAHETIWIDSANDSGKVKIPKWLSKDANLQAASRALDSQDSSTADFAYEQTLNSILLNGSYSKKDRAQRARRNIVQEFDSDFGSDSEHDGESSSKDPNAEVPNLEDLSDDDDPSFTDVPVEKRKKKKRIEAQGKVSSGTQHVAGSRTMPQPQNMVGANIVPAATRVNGTNHASNACIRPFPSHTPVAPRSNLIPIFPNVLSGGDTTTMPGHHPPGLQFSAQQVPFPTQVGTRHVFHMSHTNPCSLLVPASSSLTAFKEVGRSTSGVETAQTASQVGTAPSDLRISLFPGVVQPVRKPPSVPSDARRQNVSGTRAEVDHEVRHASFQVMRRIGEVDGSSPYSYSTVSGAAPQTMFLRTQANPSDSQHSGLCSFPSASPSTFRIAEMDLHSSAKQLSNSTQTNGGSPPEKVPNSSSKVVTSPSLAHEQGKRSCSYSLPTKRKVNGQGETLETKEIPPAPIKSPVQLNSDASEEKLGRQANSTKIALHSSATLDALVTRIASSRAAKEATRRMSDHRVPSTAARSNEQKTDGETNSCNGSGTAGKVLSFKSWAQKVLNLRNPGGSAADTDVVKVDEDLPSPEFQASARHTLIFKESKSPDSSATSSEVKVADLRVSGLPSRSTGGKGVLSVKGLPAQIGSHLSGINRDSQGSPQNAGTRSVCVLASSGASQTCSKSNRVSPVKSGPSRAQISSRPIDQAGTAPVRDPSIASETAEKKQSNVVVDLTEATDSESETWDDCVVVEPTTRSTPPNRPGFAYLVEQLRQKTAVQDTEILIEALLATNWSITAAAEFVESRR